MCRFTDQQACELNFKMSPIQSCKIKLISLALILILIIIYSIQKRRRNQSELKCKWPPSIPSNLSSDSPFNITVCARPYKLTDIQSEPIYYISNLFRLAQNFSDWRMSYNDLVKLPASMWKLAKYPQIYDIYPQNVPMKDITKKIKEGRKVTHVSF